MKAALDRLKEELKIAISEHFRRLIAEHPQELFYGYSLYTCDDVPSIGPVANRKSALQVDSADPMYNYYRYGPQEWSDWNDYGIFEQANQIITSIHENKFSSFAKKRQRILAQAFQALFELEATGLFGQKDSSRYIVLWLSDSNDPIINESAKLLNDSEVYKAFASEYAT
jgi:hypothetical protein